MRAVREFFFRSMDGSWRRRERKTTDFWRFAQIYYAKRGIVSVAKLKNWFQSEPMLDLFGKKYGGNILGSALTRRDLLRIGSIGAGGLALPEVLRAEKSQKIGSSNKSIIMVYMAGAPPHQDLIDPKPQAPQEVRSAFGPISTNVTGIHLNESLPMMAKVMDKWTGIRSLVGAPSGSHDSFMCYTGRPGSAFFDRPYPKPPGNWPSMGSSLSKLAGSRVKGLPPFVGLAPKAGHPPYGSPGESGFLGAAHGPFRPSGPSSADMKPTCDSSRIDRR